MAGKRRTSIVVTTMLLLTGLTGCAENQIPELRQDEVQAVGEYVALTMMKYDINHRSRLMDLTLLEESVLGEDPSASPEPEEVTGMAPVDDTPVVELDSDGTQGTASACTPEEVMGLPEGLELAYVAQEITDSYPAGEEYFALNASAGKKLLVLHFSLTNPGSEEQEVDILSSGAVFNVTVNESYSRRALTTMLLDDMGTYRGSVPAGGNVEVVLVIEVEEEISGQISSVILKVKNEEMTSALKLL